jgi:hypothetical protein
VIAFPREALSDLEAGVVCGSARSATRALVLHGASGELPQKASTEV